MAFTANQTIERIQSNQMPRGGKRQGAGRKKKDALIIAPVAPVAPESRAPDGRFLPGQSGNPGGRVAGVAEVSALARLHTGKAITRLVHWIDTENARASVAACVAILDRGWGKAVQTHDITHHTKPDLSKLSADELAVIEQMLAKALPAEAEGMVH